MLRTKQIETAILEAEARFERCWMMLVALRETGPKPTDLLRAFVSFQPSLGGALYKLEVLRQKVCKEARELIRNRAQSNRNWARRRLHTLNGFKHLLDQAADVGKAIGDAFAWCFYSEERDLLRRHYEQEPNPHPPTGVGGLGEIEFVKRCPTFGNYLVIGHSTTTFLRLGDFSLIDRDCGVAAIGELKTCAATEKNIKVSIVVVGRRLAKRKLPQFPPGEVEGKNLPRTPMPIALEERLKRQISRIRDSFKPKMAEAKIGTHRIEGQFHYKGLEELHSLCSQTECAYVEADRGLLLVGIRRDGGTLHNRLTDSIAPKRLFASARVEQGAKMIVDKSLPDSSIRVDWVHYPARQRYSLELGMRPLFWWPIPDLVLEALLFRRFIVMSLYNPAVMIANLRGYGLEVSSRREGGIQVRKNSAGKRLEVRGIDYLLDLIQSHLFSDAAAAGSSTILCVPPKKQTSNLPPQFS